MADMDPEYLPPEPTGIVPSRFTPMQKRIFITGVSVGPLLWFILWGFNEFTSLRGWIQVVASRLVLLGMWAAGVCVIAIIVCVWFARLRRKLAIGILIAGSLIWAAFLVTLDWLAPKPQVIAHAASHERPADWRIIKDWQKAELAPVLEQFPNNTLRIIVTSSAPDETVDYANQFKDFFHAHQWNVIGPETAATDQIVQNIQLSLSEQYWGKPPPKAFAAVESQMRFIGLRLRSSFVIDPLVSPNELVMWVGPETPPGFPEHIPLSIGMACQHPLQFTDDTMHFFGGGGKDFVRWVRIKPPANSPFSTGQKVLVVLTKPAKSVATSEQFSVQSLGTVMPRPYALDVTVAKNLKMGEPLDMKIISDEELRVKCVVDRSSN